MVRGRLQDAPEFERIKQQNAISKVPFAELVRRQPRNLVLAGLASIAPPAVGSTVIVYMLTYGTTVVGFQRGTLLMLIPPWCGSARSSRLRSCPTGSAPSGCTSWAR
ncbi:hypothetical protein [Nonomuraea sp. SYSU D8015]|uniref:hypothetical protein n=1 Tax=Nonomuraea sp. SYSU D8015 TaxID=2593644 RepID=UPI001CB702CC|nr:hypothetical protein [Nonomuraea sp. SYSU D8015]